MWWQWRKKKEHDDSVGREMASMVDMLVSAYASSTNQIDVGPTFNIGDEFTARIIVTGTYDDHVNYVIAGDEGHSRSSRDISRYRLAKIKEAA